ncbi:hypothetical protein [Limnohabitans sp.]|uniref:hypothetical protein n=1 Tax=Limnohabitans sp. TaxID=1907725 RepID=UPI00286F0FCC|nr:hypothetical protein [Limnohabitans sp.]
MKIQTQNLSPSQPYQTTRLSGFSSKNFQAATWRGEDLLLQTKKGEVWVLKGANAKRLSTPDFFLIFDDASVPLAAFAPNFAQPTAGKAPHVPQFEVAAPVKISKLPGKPIGRIQGRSATRFNEAWNTS